MSKFESFIFGKDKIPSWFNDFCSNGRARANYDDEGNIVSVVVFTISGSVIANPGDSIIFTKSGLNVVPKEKAIKYGVQRGDKNSEEKKTDNEGIQQKVDE